MRVMIVEDDRATRERFSKAIAADLRTTLAAAVGTGREAMARLPSARPDVLLVDLTNDAAVAAAAADPGCPIAAPPGCPFHDYSHYRAAVGRRILELGIRLNQPSSVNPIRSVTW